MFSYNIIYVYLSIVYKYIYIHIISNKDVDNWCYLRRSTPQRWHTSGNMWLFRWWLWSWPLEWKLNYWTTERIYFSEARWRTYASFPDGGYNTCFFFRSRLPDIPKLSHALLVFHDTPNFRWTCSMEIIGNMAFVKSATVLVGMSFWQRQNFDVIYRVLPTLPWRNNIVVKKNKMQHFAAIKGIQRYQESVLDCLPNSVGR